MKGTPSRSCHVALVPGRTRLMEGEHDEDDKDERQGLLSLDFFEGGILLEATGTNIELKQRRRSHYHGSTRSSKPGLGNAPLLQEGSANPVVQQSSPREG
ncbi:hypothetical protein NQZ68_007552 [Dissostichus eleginoides]|nr:hypothetical protein NQZ68_007552 [Dissostichus eleginoides]